MVLKLTLNPCKNRFAVAGTWMFKNTEKMGMYLGSTSEPIKRQSNQLGMFSPFNFHLQ